MLSVPLPAPKVMPRFACKAVKPGIKRKVPPFKVMLLGSTFAGTAPTLRSVLMAKVPAFTCVPPS